MTLSTRPFQALTGPGRRARWRRAVLRRGLAACCAAAAVLAGLTVLRPPPEPTSAALVAARSVPAGSVLVAADLTTTELPAAARQPGALAETSEAVGRRVGSALAPGEAVTATRLVPRTVAEGLGPGQVAMHVLLADPTAADLLGPGQLVRVYPSVGGAALARRASVLSVDPVGGGSGVGVVTGESPRGAVLALDDAAADRVLAGHGGLEGPVVVGVLAVPP